MIRLLILLITLSIPYAADAQIHNQSAIITSGGYQGQIGLYHFEFSVGDVFTQTGFSPGVINTTGILQPLTDNSSLPVVLADFDASLEEQGVSLRWTTSTEYNSRLFEVQRSADAKSWTAIGTVSATGESLIPAAYRFLDSDLPLFGTTRLVYYRLKMVDLDDSFEYSAIRSVVITPGNALLVQVYPNPVSDLIKVRHPKGVRIQRLSLLDMNGREVTRVDGDDQLDVSQLSAGLHFLIVQDLDQNISRHKILITR